MKRNRAILFVSFVLLAAFTGYFQGVGARSAQVADLLPPTFDIPPHYPTQAPRSTSQPGDAFSGQINLLIVHVDTLSAQPEPVSLWLVINHSQVARQLTWIPIYRAGHDQDTSIGQELKANLQLTPDQHLAGGFLDWFTNTYDSRLDGYLLVDSEQAAELLDALGGVEMDGLIRKGSEALELHAESRSQDPLADLNLMHGTCGRLNQLTTSINPLPLFSLVMNHLSVISDGSPAPQVISRLLNTGSLTCRFPTLQEMVFAVH